MNTYKVTAIVTAQVAKNIAFVLKEYAETHVPEGIADGLNQVAQLFDDGAAVLALKEEIGRLGDAERLQKRALYSLSVEAQDRSQRQIGVQGEA